MSSFMFSILAERNQQRWGHKVAGATKFPCAEGNILYSVTDF